MKLLEYIPYIKYVISPGTRFERDKKVLFDPDGEVSRGLPLINYGWNPSGLKELIQAFYESKHGSLKGFDEYYKTKILRRRGNIVSQLRVDELLGEDFPALIRIKVKDGVEVPALLVNIERMYFKNCDECNQCWRKTGVPSNFKDFLGGIKLTPITKIFQCARQTCKFLCENYGNCMRSYTSTEGDPETEKEKINCLVELLKQLAGLSLGSKRYECQPRSELQYNKLITQMGRPRNRRVCIERYLRFDFNPLRYFFFDYKTWSKMQRKRYSKLPRHNIDALPTRLLSDFLYLYSKYLNGTELIAPITHEGVLEAFLNVSKVRFEIKIQVSHPCAQCGLTHQITGIPIKAMFRDSEVFKHEARFAELLWQKLWEKYPREFCNSFRGKSSVSIEDSLVLKRELRVQEIFPKSPFALNSYDFAVDMAHLLNESTRLLLFDLTTGLWKKSGFHEVGRTPEDYLEAWKEMLYEIPMKVSNTVATWYIMVNSTEELFFDETAPAGVIDMNQLLTNITSNNLSCVSIVKTISDVVSLELNTHKLVVVPIFNSTQQKGEARTELKRLEKKNFNQLLMWNLVNKLVS